MSKALIVIVQDIGEQASKPTPRGICHVRKGTGVISWKGARLKALSREVCP